MREILSCTMAHAFANVQSVKASDLCCIFFSSHSPGRLNITYPMLFKLTNKNSDRMTHCGVLEFVADEGICYLPHWVSCLMLNCQNLKSRIKELPG